MVWMGLKTNGNLSIFWFLNIKKKIKFLMNGMLDTVWYVKMRHTV